MGTRPAVMWLLALLALVAAACGTRLPDEAFGESRTSVAAARSEARAGPATASDGSDAAAIAEGDSGEEAALAATPTTAAPGGTGSQGEAAGGDGGGSGPGGEAPPAPAAPEEGGGPAAAAAGPNQASDVGITADTIVIGNITAENGVLGDAFAPAVRGLRAWVQHTNSKGGINGRKIVLKTCDDREDRNRALECARRLVEQDKVFALVATNTRALGGASEYLNSSGIPVLGIPINNAFYRYPHFWSGYPHSYPNDGKSVGYNGKLMLTTSTFRWFKEELGLSKAAVFAYDIDESKQYGNAVVKGLGMEGYDVASYTVSFAAPSFDQAVADMERRGTQIVFDGMDDGANRKLCDAMARRRFKPKAKVSTIVVYGASVGVDYNDTCRNVVFVPGQSLPYTQTNVPAIKEFRDAYARYQPGLELHQWALEGWTIAALFADGVRSMGPAPTRKGLEDFLRSMRGFTAGGVLVGLDYGTTDYSKPTTKDCFTISRWLDDKGGWVLATSAFPFCYPDAKLYGTPVLEQGN